MSDTDVNAEQLRGDDSIGGDIQPLSKEFEAYLRTTLPKREVSTFSSTNKTFKSHLVDRHKLVIEGLAIQYVYGLERRIIDGVWHFNYGITATELKEDFQGMILHHTGDKTFDFYLQYTQRHDKDRGGTYGYHFLIGRDGRIAQTAPLTKRTNHISPKDNRTDALDFINNNTVSVCLQGGYRGPKDGPYEHVPATAMQLQAAQIVVDALSNLYALSRNNVWGHGEVQNNRMLEEALVLAKQTRAGTGFG